jgi:hypothetical protein
MIFEVFKGQMPTGFCVGSKREEMEYSCSFVLL